jgi:hypothetical protein
LAYRAATTIPRSKRRDAGYARNKIAYPSEFLMKVSITGQWHRDKYRLRNHCLVPEFLSESFGDSDTKCTLCFDDFGGTTCSRKTVNGIDEQKELR